MSDQDIPVVGDVTVTFAPESAAEVAMVLQHILHNVPDNPRPDQAARAHWLGRAALVLSDGLVQAMRDAGLSDELIARASGRITVSAPEQNAAQLALAPEPEPEPEVHPLDQADEPVNLSPPVDFPTPGGPPDAA